MLYDPIERLAYRSHINHWFERLLAKQKAIYKSGLKMVKPNELRIGNLLRYADNNQYVRIKTIGEKDCRVEFIVGSTGQEKTVAFDKLKGIVLTPERIKFMGFKNTYEHYYSSNQAYLELKLVDVDFWVWTGSNEAIGKRFNDVNQLQNIFFALMHYELEFTLQDA